MIMFVVNIIWFDNEIWIEFIVTFLKRIVNRVGYYSIY